MTPFAFNGMAEAPYLVALALFEQDGGRAMPLAGRSQLSAAADDEAPVPLGHALVLELLLRIKAAWLNTGDTQAFKAALQTWSPRAWTVWRSASSL